MRNVKQRASNILQHGEAAGHYHQAQGDGVSVMEREGTDEVWMLAPNGAIVVHQEHNPVTLPPSLEGYDRTIVREYDHFAEEARQVQD